MRENTKELVKVWQLQEAKAKFSEVINMTQYGVQIISRHGIEEAVIMSMEKYKELTGERGESFIDWMKRCGVYGIGVDLDPYIKREKEKDRDINLDEDEL